VNLMADLRLLPLLPSATEIVHALGLGEFQIGRSHECDYPPGVLTLPVCSSPAIPVNGSSPEIDSLVKQRLQNALSIYRVDSALIDQLQPTHIITQTQCKVCAVSPEDLQRETPAQIISLEPHGLHDLWADILRVGAACGQPDRARKLNAHLQNRMSALAETATKATRRPRVAALEWLEPLLPAAHWVPELIWIACGESVNWTQWEDILKEDPDILIAQPCGFDLPRTRHEMRWLTSRPGWDRLTAVRTGQVYLCDGNQFLNRPGPRLVESLQILGEIFHPELFPPTMEGIGWENLQRQERSSACRP
jgi:iron complex transport system substrate-binding protein